MTEPIPKHEQTGRAVRWLVLGIALAALFAGLVLTILLVLPRPHTAGDYMMAGGVATMVTMLALFATLLTTKFHTRDAFYKRRPKE